MGNEVDIREYFDEDNASEKINILMQSVNKLATSEFLRRKNIYVDIKKKVSKVVDQRYDDLE